MNRTKNFLERLLPFIACLAGLHFTVLGICHYDLSKIPGDLGDARFNMYVLEHGYRFFKGADSSFWSAPFMYPFPNTIALSDNLLGTLPVYSFFRMLSLDRETAFQCWLISLCILNFAAAYLVVKKSTGN